MSTAHSRRFYHPLQRDATTFLETSAESGGQRTLIQVELAPGGDVAPRRHVTYAQHFEVLEGRLTLTLGSAEHELQPGDTAVAPAGMRHSVRNPTDDTVVFRVELRPGSPSFERMLVQRYVVLPIACSAVGRIVSSGT